MAEVLTTGDITRRIRKVFPTLSEWTIHYYVKTGRLKATRKQTPFGRGRYRLELEEVLPQLVAIAPAAFKEQVRLALMGGESFSQI